MNSLIADFAIAFTPPPKLTVSEWADLKRKLPEKSGAAGASWRTERTPYLRGIMNAVHEPGVKSIAVMKSAQVGGSEAINNILGYHMEYDPCAMMLVQPTDKVAEEFSKERLADMLRTSPAIGSVIDESTSTLTLKMFPGGFLVIGGANSENTFARRSARLVIGDDVDRWPAVLGDEGDPVDLLWKRTTTYHNGLMILVSTPTLRKGRIDSAYERSDQRRYFVRCLRCGREDWITWSDAGHFHVSFDANDPSSARLSCAGEEYGGCGAHLSEAVRRQLVNAGEWHPTVTASEPGAVGFHLPAMITTLGTASLSTWVGDWLNARARGRESLRVFINTTLAEAWEDRGSRMNANALTSRKEDYGDGIEVPASAVAITAGVDVQDNRFEIGVTAWAQAEERFVVDHRIVPGDPRRPETRAELLRALERKYIHATGALLPIHAACIDTGFATDEMYEFVLAYQVKRIFATKGFAGRGGNPIVGKPSEVRYGKNPRPVRLYPINVDDAKGAIMDALAIVPSTGGAPSPGAVHFPAHLEQIDEEFFAQLCSEHKETRRNKIGVATHEVWVLDRERNEALDIQVLCLAAKRLLNPNIRQMLEALGVAQRSAPTAVAAGETPPARAPIAVQQPTRRVSHSSYLGR